VPNYEFIVENEWTTMELARRCGLPVAPVRVIDFDIDSPYRRSLLVERYDIPTARELAEVRHGLLLPLQEDACSLLRLPRADKYKTSIERVAVALRDSGLQPDDLWVFLRHVVFSWLAGNGDLHAKNFSVLRMIRPGQLGASPELASMRYSPLYDLVNTRILIPNDEFALPVNGKQNNVRLRDIAQVAERWKGDRKRADEIVMEIATGMRSHLDEVLNARHIPTAMAERYRNEVDTRLSAVGV
jgi:serine/threonine-protein kinase HipA